MKKEEYLPYGKSKEGKALWECLKRMYKEAEPSADIEKIAKSGEGKMPNFFMAYYLTQERFDEICKEVLKEFKLTGWRKRQVEQTLFLGSSPTSSREAWKKERKDYSKRLKKYLDKIKSFEVPIVCKMCGGICEWDDDGICEKCGKEEYKEKNKKTRKEIIKKRNEKQKEYLESITTEDIKTTLKEIEDTKKIFNRELIRRKRNKNGLE